MNDRAAARERTAPAPGATPSGVPSHDVRWWWVRHAPVINHGGKLYGQRDVPCDVSDARAFASLAAALPEGAVWVTSHLMRARDTAAAVADAGLAPGGAVPAPIIEHDFAEQNFGDWAGLSWEEIAARDPAFPERFWSDPVGLAPPGGESFAAVVARVAATIARLSAAYRGDIVAVAHGGVIRAAIATALALDPARAMAVRIDNLSLTRLDLVAGGTLRGKGGAWRVVGVNRPPY
ncbi:MAG: histidine phosphatase family protein [Rhodospirillales bacterium]|nr:histidine phosphatase family protein [Rhodospirillales bacterium]